jgi:DNA replication protein DnaC
MTELRSRRYWRNRSDEERAQNTLIPRRFRQDTLDTFKVQKGDEKTFALIESWVNNAEKHVEDGQGLYIVGATGSGKTHLAQAALKRAVYKHNLCGVFVTADKYIQMAYNEVKFSGELPEGYEDPNTLKYMQEVYDIVVLDSLGTERPTDFTRKAICSLIESRYHEKLTTIVTSTYKPDSLTTMYSKSVSSILSACCYVAPLRNEDYRINKWMDEHAGE